MDAFRTITLLSSVWTDSRSFAISRVISASIPNPAAIRTTELSDRAKMKLPKSEAPSSRAMTA